jgi:hypothetical protein
MIRCGRCCLLQKRIEYWNKRHQQSTERKLFVANLEKGSNRYEIVQDALLIVLGKSITHTVTKSEWEVAYKSDGLIEAEISVLKEEQQLGGEWSELFHLMKKLTLPLQKINFELSPQGYILNILNGKEIYSKWIDVKKEFINDSSFSEVIKLGDVDYSNPLPTIKKNIIYPLFFFSLYKKGYFMNKQVVVEKDVLLQSVIFPECNFAVNIEEKAYERTGDYVFFNQNTVEKNTDFSKVKSLYDERYKPFMAKNASRDEGIGNYSISYKSNYKVFEEFGKLVHCKATFEEIANRDLYYKSNIEIKLID